MNYLHHEDDLSNAEREFTLSTGSILGLFFGLVLLCGLFFGFGYSLGSHRSAPAGTSENEAVSKASPAAAPHFGAFKPAAGLPAGASNSVPVPVATMTTTPTPAATTSRASNESEETEVAVSARSSAGSTPGGSPGVGAGSGGAAAPIVRVSPPTVRAAQPAGYFLVQVAAVSHPQDAELLLSALHSKGYAAVAAHIPQDQFIHIEIGPFTSRRDAESTRARLAADGYSPIVK